MRKLRLAAVTSAAAAALIACGSPGTGENIAGHNGSSHSHSHSAAGSGQSTEVTTKLLKFEPEKISVKAGTTLTWNVSDGIAHTVTTGTFSIAGDGLRNSEQPDGKVDLPLRKGQPVSYTFTEPGKYVYYCSIHKGMNGEVEVTP